MFKIFFFSTGLANTILFILNPDSIAYLVAANFSFTYLKLVDIEGKIK